jgi:fatty-acyl-CoA synthase
MFDRHMKFWPRGVARRIRLPETNVAYNLTVTARRYPSHPALSYCGRDLSYAELAREAECLAGYLQAKLGVAKGDRVILFMENSPQFVIAFYAILRADAVVVPVNPMNRMAELEYIVGNTGAKVSIIGEELVKVLAPLAGSGGISHTVVAAYGDYTDPAFDLPTPPEVSARSYGGWDLAGGDSWRNALAAALTPAEMTSGPDDWAVFPYSSGTTGNPKGCVHTHRSVMATAMALAEWTGAKATDASLTTLPMFHVTGMQASMNMPIYVGATMVIMPRWNSRVAAELIKRHRVARWITITTMVIDLVNDPAADTYDLSSLNLILGGGSAMPEAVAAKLGALTGLEYVEGYGLSETMAPTHLNPLDRPKRQCLGIPIFDVDCRILDLDSGRELGPDETGEIVISGPQLLQEYWNNPGASAAAFIERDGKRFLRTGDIGKYDEEGYFFIVDRLKRMINVSGYKVWPTEVEAFMHRHPAIAEVCIISTPDPRTGEAVKAVVVPQPSSTQGVTEQSLIAWCRSTMSAYKCPHSVKFIEALPRSATGKVQWRQLQEQEWAAAGDGRASPSPRPPRSR